MYYDVNNTKSRKWCWLRNQNLNNNFYTPSTINLITPFLYSGSPLTLCTATYLRHLFVLLVNHTGDLHKHLTLWSNCANGSADKAHSPPPPSSRSHQLQILILVLLEVQWLRLNHSPRGSHQVPTVDWLRTWF